MKYEVRTRVAHRNLANVSPTRKDNCPMAKANNYEAKRTQLAISGKGWSLICTHICKGYDGEERDCRGVKRLRRQMVLERVTYKSRQWRVREVW